MLKSQTFTFTQWPAVIPTLFSLTLYFILQPADPLSIASWLLVSFFAYRSIYRFNTVYPNLFPLRLSTLEIVSLYLIPVLYAVIVATALSYLLQTPLSCCWPSPQVEGQITHLHF